MGPNRTHAHPRQGLVSGLCRPEADATQKGRHLKQRSINGTKAERVALYIRYIYKGLAHATFGPKAASNAVAWASVPTGLLLPCHTQGIARGSMNEAVACTSVARRFSIATHGASSWVQVPWSVPHDLLLRLARKICSCLTAAVSRACLAVSSATCPTRRRHIDIIMPMKAPACTAATDGVEREACEQRGGLDAARRRKAPQGAARRRKAPGWALQQPP